MIQKIIFLCAIISTSCATNLCASDCVQEDDVKLMKMAKIFSSLRLNEKKLNSTYRNNLLRYNFKKNVKNKGINKRNLINNKSQDLQQQILDAKYRRAKHIWQTCDDDPGHQRKIEFTKLIQDLKSKNYPQAFSLHNKITLNSKWIKQVKEIEDELKLTVFENLKISVNEKHSESIFYNKDSVHVINDDCSQDDHIVVDDEFVDY